MFFLNITSQFGFVGLGRFFGGSFFSVFFVGVFFSFCGFFCFFVFLGERGVLGFGSGFFRKNAIVIVNTFIKLY